MCAMNICAYLLNSHVGDEECTNDSYCLGFSYKKTHNRVSNINILVVTGIIFSNIF